MILNTCVLRDVLSRERPKHKSISLLSRVLGQLTLLQDVDQRVKPTSIVSPIRVLGLLEMIATSSLPREV